MTRRILAGLQNASHVTCDTAATHDAILAHSLIPRHRLTIVHNGVHPALTSTPDPVADTELERMLKRRAGTCPELLHVGSTISRKRIDVLLRVFAEVRRHEPSLRLLRVGGAFTTEQRSLAASLNLSDSIDVLPPMTPELLGAAYRRASVLLQTSESEGFGLPVIEAMACGTPVIASDIAPLREIGGRAAIFCAVGDIPLWTNAVIEQLQRSPDSTALSAQTAKFCWSNYAATMADTYRRVLEQVSEP